MRITAEVHFHTAEQVETYVTEGLRLCDTLGLSDADRAVLLPKVVELLASKQVALEQPAALLLDASKLASGPR